MQHYEIYCLDAVTQNIASAMDFIARDDLDALTEAEKFCGKGPVEVWQGPRRVVRVKQDNAALNASDRCAL